MFPCFVFLAVTKEQIYMMIVWIDELGTMSRSRECVRKLMLDSIGRKKENGFGISFKLGLALI